MILEEFVDRVHQMALDKGWNANCKGNVDRAGMKIALMHSELSEALEEIRNGHAYDEIYYNEGSSKPEGVEVEMADTIIRILDFCKANGINIVEALEIKANFNDGRSFRHGGKLA